MFFSESLKKSEKKTKKIKKKKMPNVLKRPNPGYFFVYVPGRYLKITLKFSDFKGTLSGIALRNTRFWQQKKCKIVFKKNFACGAYTELLPFIYYPLPIRVVKLDYVFRVTLSAQK